VCSSDLSGMKFERAAIVFLAANGLMLGNLLRTSPFNIAEQYKIKKEILQVIHEEVKKK
jgi:hypothetical protein